MVANSQSKLSKKEQILKINKEKTIEMLEVAHSSLDKFEYNSIDAPTFEDNYG